MSGDGETSETRYLVVSADGHVGPYLVQDLRPYCPAKYLDVYDDFTRECDRVLESGQFDPKFTLGTEFPFGGPEANLRSMSCPGLNDPEARRRDMDTEGIAADVIFAGGGNNQPVPFVGFGAGAGPHDISGDLRAVGGQIWNEWLVDFISGAPERHVGVMQIPIWDIDAAIRTLHWGRNVGLLAANFPASRVDFPAYNDPVYEPFWSTCEELGITLMTHTGGGQPAHGAGGPGGMGVMMGEGQGKSTLSLSQMIFSGVFERHPRLQLMYAELRVSWVPELLRNMDSLYYSDSTPPTHCELISRPPSEYWHANCFNSGSFLAPFEVALRHEVGLRNQLWGADYPHTEGTWPRTRLSLRHTFAGVPEHEARMILGENAVDVLGLDRAALRKVADQIGPLPSEISRPLGPEDIPDRPGLAFRRMGTFA